MHLPTDDKYWVPPMPEIRKAPLSGRVLCLAPHPDDEAAGPGGALVKHRRQGDPVRVALATDGIAGDPDGRYDQATYAEGGRPSVGIAYVLVNGQAVVDNYRFVEGVKPGRPILGLKAQR